MTVEAVGDTARVALSADWCELMAITSSRRSTSSADLLRSRAALEEDEHGIEFDDDEEPVETEIINYRLDEWVSDVREELYLRATSLQLSYPFTIHGSGDNWRLEASVDDQRHDHLLYICCLLVTGSRWGLVTPKFDELDRVLQVIAYLVAGRVVQGEAYWFGWPRPDHSRMEDAVKDLLVRMGFDDPTVVRPIWSVGREKDEGIDVVAWRNFGDRLASRLVLYGQVASGKNWEDKPVTKEADSTWTAWVGDRGQRYYVPAMFIPWPQYLDVTAADGRSFRQRVVELAIRNEKRYGLTLDRGRIAELAGASVSTGNADESELVAFLTDWQSEAITIASD